jgi:hypothetical protein
VIIFFNIHTPWWPPLSLKVQARIAVHGICEEKTAV